jgi:periplasmic protein TonB
MQAAQTPIDKISSLGTRIPLAWMVGLAILLHAGIAGGAAGTLAWQEFPDWMGQFRKHLRDRILQDYEVDLIKDEPPKPPAPEKPPEPEAPPEKKEIAKEVKSEPPAAAQAAKILAAEPNPNDPVDMTNAFVQGTAENFAGGKTMAAGTATTAVKAIAPSATGVVGGTGTAAVSAGPDQSRGLRLRGGRDWNCPFPPEADIDQIDNTSVNLEVSARGDGTIESVRVTSDPGHGFGREAKACAMRQGFDAALDRDGKGIAAKKVFRVSFNR